MLLGDSGLIVTRNAIAPILTKSATISTVHAVADAIICGRDTIAKVTGFCYRLILSLRTNCDACIWRYIVTHLSRADPSAYVSSP